MNNYDLINARKNAGYSQTILAAILGISQQFIASMEKGRKPLTEKAIEFILNARQPSGGYAGMGFQKTAKKVVNKSLKNKEVREMKVTRNCAETKFSEIQDARGWERWWWQRKHALCLKCQKECKQSSFVKIIVCPQFSCIA